jgi:hypothetical protein
MLDSGTGLPTMLFLLHAHLYLHVLFAAAIATAGGVIWWAMNNSDIDPGEPNARVGSYWA